MSLLTEDWLEAAIKDERLKEQTRPTFLCLMDILGFKSLIARNRIFDIAVEQTRYVEFARTIATGELLGIKGEKFPPGKCQFLRFSDSILIYTETTDRLELFDLVIVAAHFMGNMIVQGIPVRAAITQGELYVSRDKTVFLGEGLIRAYELEQSQDWMGGLVDEERLAKSEGRKADLELLVRRGELHRHVPPLKKTPAVEPRLCIGWPHSLPENMRERLWNKLTERNPPNDDRESAKLNRGLDFYDAYIRESENSALRRDLWERMKKAVSANKGTS